MATMNQLQQIEQKAEELLELIMEAVPHDPRIDYVLMAGRALLASVLAIVKHSMKEPAQSSGSPMPS
jgi:hypothetical protein